MPIQVNQCELCSHNQSSLFDERSFQGVTISNRLCSRCGLVFQSPRLSEKELDAFYRAEYRQLYQGEVGPNQKDLSIQKGRARALTNFIYSQKIQPVRHLDIGCSSGLLLSQFKKAFSSQAVGIEPGDAYRKFAQDLELEVFTSLEELGKIDDRQFDLISLAHVLEHIPQPLEYLRNLKNKWLSPNGHLLVEVPNLYGHDCFEIAHMISYSHHTLRETLRQAGFQITTVKLHGEPRSKILALYITALAEPLQSGSISPPVPEKNVRLKRKYGMLRRQIQARLFPKKAWLPVNNVSL